MPTDLPVSKAHRGMGLEAMLNFGHQLYLNRNDDVMVEHNGTRGKFIGQARGKPKFVPHGSKSAPDYYGCIDGRFIAFDAKTTRNKTRWNLDLRSEHQHLKLLDWSAAGAVCWFAVEFKLTDTLYLFRVDHRYEPVRPSVKLPPAVDLRIITCAMTAGWYDWLPLVRFGWLDE